MRKATRTIVKHKNDHKSNCQSWKWSQEQIAETLCYELDMRPTSVDHWGTHLQRLYVIEAEKIGKKKERKPLPCSWQCFLGLISSKEQRQSPWHSPATPLGRNIELQRWDWSGVYFVHSQWRDNLSLALEKKHLIIFSSHLADVKVDSFLAQFLTEVIQVEVDQGVHLRQGFLLQCGCEGVGYVLNTHLLSKLEM